MNKIHFIFCLHNHQPNGNFDFVFEKAYQQAYQPFLDTLKKFPSIKFTQHYTGVLLEWIETHHPDFLKELKSLVKKDQVEMLSGGFYEPILPVIPDPDKVAQIEKLSGYVKKTTGYSPRGMWLAERVWEPSLPGPIGEAGMEFTTLDDTHFKYAGLQNEQLFGYYGTEDQGSALKIFPISKFLRYSIPFQDPQHTIDYFHGIADHHPDSLIVFGDDGEKFGSWPEMYHHVYENRWLERFLEALQQNSEWIETIHFSDALKKFPQKGMIYLPTASYSEMLHWSLFPESFRKYEQFEGELKSRGIYDPFENFVRGGFWRNFLAKYPEANHLHKRMLGISERIRQIEGSVKKDLKKKKLISRAREKLYASQSNDCYWHGVFGGLYLNYLRTVGYKNLIEAEILLDQVEKRSGLRIHEEDFDSDGQNELILETPHLNVYFETGEGGGISEMDFRPAAFNLTDVLTRREEGYHDKLKDPHGSGDGAVASIHDRVKTKEANLDQFLFYDHSRRLHLNEQFYTEGENFENVYQAKQHQVFRSQKVTHKVKKGKGHIEIQFENSGELAYRDQWWPVQVIKKIRVHDAESEIRADLTIKNLSQQELKFKFGVELVFTLLAGNAEDRSYTIGETKLEDARLNSKGENPDVTRFGAKDTGYLMIDLQFRVNRPATLWRFPLETISLSEDGFEKAYQGSVMLPNWSISLQDQWNIQLVQQISCLGDLQT